MWCQCLVIMCLEVNGPVTDGGKRNAETGVKHDELLELNPNCYSIAAVSASLISEGLLDSQSKR